MQLTVCSEVSEAMYYVQVDGDQHVRFFLIFLFSDAFLLFKLKTDDIKAVLEVETSIPMGQQQLFLNGQPLASTTISAAGIKDGDVLLLRRLQQQRPQSAARVNPNDPRSLYNAVRADPSLMATLRHVFSPPLAQLFFDMLFELQNNPDLAAAASQPTADAFVKLFNEQQMEKEKREEEAMLRRVNLFLSFFF